MDNRRPDMGFKWRGFLVPAYWTSRFGLLRNPSFLAHLLFHMVRLCAAIERAVKSWWLTSTFCNLLTFVLELACRPLRRPMKLIRSVALRAIQLSYRLFVTARPSGATAGTNRTARGVLNNNNNQPPEPMVTVEELAGQLERLSENVANLQAAGDEFKQHQESLLDDIGQMKAYLELLYHQLKHDEELLDYANNNDYAFPDKAGQQSHLMDSKTINPPAEVETSMDEFHLSIQHLYQDRTNSLIHSTWLRPPREGDYFLLTFTQPALLKRFKIATGHYQHPANKMSNATVEILPASCPVVRSDRYVIVGRFDHSGLAQGVIDWQAVGPVRSLRVKLHSGCLNWIIMTDLLLEVAQTGCGHVGTLPVINELTEEEFESW